LATWTLQAHARERPASVAPPGLAANSARDVLRLSGALDWRRDWVTQSGLVVTGLAGLDVDAYNIRQDPTFGDSAFVRAVPYGGLELRLPLARRDAAGVRHVIEPVAQLIFAPSNRPVTPDEDSLTPEFDEGNLFSTSRFAGRDTRELGNRLNIGIGYTRFDPSGWTVGAQVGRVIRQRDLGQFRPGTGIDGQSSDWIVAASIGHDGGFELLQRSLFDDQFTFSRSETILNWTGERHSLQTRYTYLEADPTAGRPLDTSEWAVDSSVDLGRDWTGRANWRYDFVTNDASRAGLGLTYRSDCVTVDFDVERRFTSTATLQPSTSFGLSVELAGFGADDRRTRARTCGL
ncbi:MAG: LPS assembly protein LptD, partial [Jannaschia sp.]